MIIKTKRDFIVKRKDNLYNHCHFNNFNDALKFIRLIEFNKLPYSDYWINSAKRLLTEIEFNELKSKL